MKITEANYQLHEVYATEPKEQLGNGANKPLTIRGINRSTNSSGVYVLKYRGAERMDEAACGRELLASFLAAQLEILVPRPVIIHVNQAFIDKTRGQDYHQNVSKSAGINFGCNYLKANPDMPQQGLTKQQMQQAARIFLFDVVMQNSDRRVGKPNMFLFEENIYIIDHEILYGFLGTLPFLQSAKPWILNETDVKACKGHFFFPTLHNSGRVSWSIAGETFLNVDEVFWQKARQLLPAGWMSVADFDRTKNRFEQIQTNFSTFNTELWNKVLTS